MLAFTGERIVPEAGNCEPNFARKMYQEHIARYLFASQRTAGKHVLDVGCGVGYGARALAERGAASVTAFDLSEDAVAHGRVHYAHPALEFRVDSAETFSFGRTYDVVTCFELIEHVPDAEKVFARLRAHLAEGGLLFISTPRALAEKRTHFHTKEFSQAEFRAALERHFPHVEFFVENNHVSSLVGAPGARRLERVEYVGEMPLDLAHADYFVCVASDRPLQLGDLAPQLVLNDEAYLKLLEHDVEVLHRAEDDQKAARAVLEGELASLRQSLDAASGELAGVRAELARTQEELRVRMSPLGQDMARRFEAGVAERVALNKRVHELEVALAAARTEAEAYRRRAESAEASYHHVLGSKSWRYGEALRASRRGLRSMVQRGRAVGQRLLVAGPSAAPALQGPAAPAAPPQARLETDVLFVIGCHEGESKRYRVHNVAEALAPGTRTAVVKDNELGALAERGFAARAVVLFRAAWAPELEAFVERARAQGVRVFFDVDDLVFEPDAVDNVRVVRDRFSKEERAGYVEGVRRYRRMLLACDAVTVPTEFLRERAQALGKPAFVLRNTLNQLQRETARSIAPRPADGTVRVGYFSGSNTHQVDFAAAEPALLRLMEARPEVRLVLVGILDLGPAWERFADRVEKVPFQPYAQMQRTLASVDVNIAPLELGNPYCEGKSQLKFFEAGLVGVPTVASATSAFREVIRDGEDGLLATDAEAWFAALDRLVGDAELRRAVGERARARALELFTQEALAPVAREVLLEAKLERPRRKTPAGTRSLRVSWVVPGLPLGSGGHRNILRVAYHLQRFGHELALYFTDTQDTDAALQQRVLEHFYPLVCPTRRYAGQVDPCDVLMATHWSTVEHVIANRTQARHLGYFVQDFEPMFYPMGTEYILAENTYRKGLYHITSGPWCAQLLREQFKVPAEHFTFPIETDVYHARAPRPAGGPKRVLFFARPEMPRRCYDLGLSMLSALHARAPEVELHLYGSRDLAHRSFPFPAQVHALVPDTRGLAELYASCDLGVAFSTTNPSLVPYEMMACGLPVVDMGRPGNEVNYGGRTDIALLADPEPATMAAQVAQLLDDDAQRAARARAGLELVAGMPNEEQMARRVEELLLRLAP